MYIVTNKSKYLAGLDISGQTVRKVLAEKDIQSNKPAFRKVFVTGNDYRDYHRLSI